MSVSTTYKPSPLGYGSSPSRSSPFRRPESPASPSPLRQATPSQSPTKNRPSGSDKPTTPTALRQTPPLGAETMRPASPSRTLEASPTTAACKSLGSGNALSRLQPSQVGTLRDGFQILDRDCDGVVNHDDVADMLGQLGLPNGPSYLTPFFPPSRPTSISLAAFLNSLAEALAGLSPSSELLSAFSAFDDDDSGQVDWAELRAALLRPAAGSDPNERPLTAAEVDKIVDGFTGRRAFNRNMTAQLGAKKGDVFRYQEFVDSIMGSNGAGSEGASHETETDAGW